MSSVPRPLPTRVYTFCVLHTMSGLTLVRPTAAPTATSFAYFEHSTFCVGRPTSSTRAARSSAAGRPSASARRRARHAMARSTAAAPRPRPRPRPCPPRLCWPRPSRSSLPATALPRPSRRAPRPATGCCGRSLARSASARSARRARRPASWPWLPAARPRALAAASPLRPQCLKSRSVVGRVILPIPTVRRAWCRQRAGDEGAAEAVEQDPHAQRPVLRTCAPHRLRTPSPDTACHGAPSTPQHAMLWFSYHVLRTL